jgi:hypothetical protein
MKRKSLLSLLVPLVFLVGCSEIDYNHPLDSQASYGHDDYFADDDNDSTANLWDEDHPLYQSLLDKEPPKLTLIGLDTVRIPFKDPNHVLEQYKKDYTVTDNKPNPIVTVIADFSVDFARTNQIKYIATDAANNSVTVTRTVIILPDSVKDIIKPQIYVANVNLEIMKGESFDPRKNVTAFDETDTGLTSKITIEGTVNTAVKGEYTLTYTVRDNSGNIGTLVRKITVRETIGPDDDYPVITLTGSNPMHIKATEQYVEPGYSAYDTTDGDITSLVKVSSTIKDNPGTYTVTYSVTDISLKNVTQTRTVIRDQGGNVGDTVAPVITLKNKKDSVITITKGGTFKAPEVIISDNKDNIPVDSMKIYGEVKTDVVGTYNVTLLVADKSGNEGRLPIKVKVVDGTADKTPPVITLKGKNPDTVGVSATASYAYKDSATAMDNKDGDITAKISITGAVDRTKDGKNTLTYIVKDAAGLADTATRIVIVKQDVKPDLFTKYNVPAAAALATLSKTYKSAEIDGDATNAPSLSTITEFRIDWNKTQNTMNSLSINMPNPVNYIDLKASATHTLGQAGPTIKFTGVTKIAKFDGEYYVTVDGTNFVMVKKDGSFAIVMKP